MLAEVDQGRSGPCSSQLNRTWLLGSLPHADLAADAAKLSQGLPPLCSRGCGLPSMTRLS